MVRERSDSEQIPIPGVMGENDDWWGRFRIPMEQTGSWRIGPLSLWIQRQPQEWRIAYKQSEDHLDPAVRVVIPDEVGDLLSMDKVTRYSFASDSEVVVLTPRLADRAVISRPEKPFVVPADEELTVYLSTPLWVRIQAGDPPKDLCEIPLFQPSDTWFGPPTDEGELCYAGRAYMRLNLEMLPLRPHRATTAVLVRNRGREPLPIERMNLPVRHLSLFQGPDFDLWTENVVFERPPGEEVIQLRLRETIGKSAWEGAKRLAEPREPLHGGVMTRALGSLFS